MVRDLIHGVRLLGAAPLQSAVVVLSLALGIGVNTAVFSWVQAFALAPLPGVPRAAEFHLIEPRTETGGYPGASWLEFKDLQARLRGVVEPVAFRMAPLGVGEPPRVERAYALLVSDGYFGTLGVQPVHGRTLDDAEIAVPGAAPVAVVSHRFWLSRLAGAPEAIGRSLRINGIDVVVVGVLPDGFQGTVIGLQFDLWVPATMAPVLLGGSRELEDRRSRGYSVMARLPSRERRDAVATAATAVMSELAVRFPETNRGLAVELLPYWRPPRGPQRMFVQALSVLQGLMLVLLLAVCGNAATLLLARAASRRRELAVRLALGASPWRVSRLLMAEALVVGVLGAGLGAALAAWSVQALRAAPPTTALPIRFQADVDGTGLAVAMLLGVVSALLVALLPAIQVFRFDVSSGVAAGARAVATGWWRSATMAAEVALATVVLVVATLFLGTFADTRDAHPGFERDGVLLAAFDRAAAGGDDAAARRFAAEALARLRALPGVDGAAIASSVPLDIHGLPQRTFMLEGRPRLDGVVDRIASNVVTPEYFEVMKMRWLEGPGLASLDDIAAPPQVVVNRAFVDRYVADGLVLGRRLEQGERTYVIAGVVATAVSDRFGEPPTPAMYFSYRDRPSRSGELHLRTRPGAEGALAGVVRSVMQSLDPAAPIFNVRTLDEHVENNLLLERIPARLFLVLGPLLLALAASGIHATVAHAVSARHTEIGVRLALGATARRVVGELMAAHLGVVATGVLAGWLVVWIVYTRVMGAGTDLRAFLGAPALLVAVAALSSWLPARRAAGVDPVITLKAE